MSIKEKRRITRLLESHNIDEIIKELRQLPPTKVINPLIGALCSNNQTVRWHAITALGPVMSDLADKDMEAARIVMRRFMWSLNDESGGIGWGAPEAMGEIMALHDKLAEEYGHMLVAYMREDGFYLELPQLQQGLMWGLARFAMVNPDLLKANNVVNYLLPYLDSNDPAVRGQAAWALGLLQAREATKSLEKLVHDPARVTIFLNRNFVSETVGSLAHKALADISKDS